MIDFMRMSDSEIIAWATKGRETMSSEGDREFWRINGIKDNQREQVNHPTHYNTGDIEVIEAIFAWGWGEAFCLGSAVKYLARAGHKSPETKIQDFQKAKRYIDFILDWNAKQTKRENARIEGELETHADKVDNDDYLEMAPEDIIAHLRDLAKDSESHFSDDGDDKIFRVDSFALRTAANLIIDYRFSKYKYKRRAEALEKAILDGYTAHGMCKHQHLNCCHCDELERWEFDLERFVPKEEAKNV